MDEKDCEICGTNESYHCDKCRTKLSIEEEPVKDSNAKWCEKCSSQPCVCNLEKQQIHLQEECTNCKKLRVRLQCCDAIFDILEKELGKEVIRNLMIGAPFSYRMARGKGK